MWREQVAGRDVLRELARRDLLLRYQHAWLGVGWALSGPLVNLAVFTAVVGPVAGLEAGAPYPLWAAAGLLPWTLLASSIRFAATSLSSNPALVGKIWFPREALPLATVLVALVDFLVGNVLLVALLGYYGVAPSLTWIYLPAVLAVELAFVAGSALLIALATLFWRDVRFALEIVLTAWMFATPVVIPTDRLTGPVATVLEFNPMAAILDAWRATLLRGEAPDTVTFPLVTLFAVGWLLAAWWIFHRAEPGFAERL